jgi:hypothetical protein
MGYIAPAATADPYFGEELIGFLQDDHLQTRGHPGSIYRAKKAGSTAANDYKGGHINPGEYRMRIYLVEYAETPGPL